MLLISDCVSAVIYDICIYYSLKYTVSQMRNQYKIAIEISWNVEKTLFNKLEYGVFCVNKGNNKITELNNLTKGKSKLIII